MRSARRPPPLPRSRSRATSKSARSRAAQSYVTGVVIEDAMSTPRPQLRHRNPYFLPFSLFFPPDALPHPPAAFFAACHVALFPSPRRRLSDRAQDRTFPVRESAASPIRTSGPCWPDRWCMDDSTSEEDLPPIFAPSFHGTLSQRLFPSSHTDVNPPTSFAPPPSRATIITTSTLTPSAHLASSRDRRFVVVDSDRFSSLRSAPSSPRSVPPPSICYRDGDAACH